MKLDDLFSDNYEVRFYDGFHKAVRGNKMSKMKEADFQVSNISVKFLQRF